MFRLTPVVKNLLIINVVVFILQHIIPSLTVFLSMFPLSSPNFRPYQLFTYMFAHSTLGFTHILFNMLGLVFLGPLLEQFWGSKRFLTFYLVTGLGAGILFAGIEYVRIDKMETEVGVYADSPNPDDFASFFEEHRGKYRDNETPGIIQFIDQFGEDNNKNNEQYIQQSIQLVDVAYKRTLNTPMLGASGAIYGILMAFGLLFPNTKLMLIFPPIPVKAKYLVMVLGGLAIWQGFSQNPNDNVAHFAHLGGMIFAFIMIMIWKQERNKFY